MSGIFVIRSIKPILPAFVEATIKLNMSSADNVIGILTATPYDVKVIHASTIDKALTHHTRNVNLVAGCIGISATQPALLNDFYMSHDGAFSRTPEKWSQGFTHDTNIALAGIVDCTNQMPAMGVGSAIAYVASELKGSTNSWLFDKKQRRLYIWRRLASVWYGMIQGHMVYSSNRDSGVEMLMMPDAVVYEAYFNFSPRPVSMFTTDEMKGI